MNTSQQPANDNKKNTTSYTKSYKEQTIDCDSREFNQCNLHLFIKRLSKKEQNSFGEKIARTGVKILFHEYSDETENPLISIEITNEQFVKIFKGKIDYKLCPYSSRDGYYCQLIIKKYRIPHQYEKIIKCITVPDGQLY